MGSVIVKPDSISNFEREIENFGTTVAIFRARKRNLPVDYSQPTSQKFFDDSGRYCPAPALLADLLEEGYSLSEIETGLYEFRLYWQERGERPTMANNLFVRHLKERKKNFQGAD